MSLTNKNIFIIIALGLLLIVVSNVIGHFAPPFSILITPILMTIIIGGLNYPIFRVSFNLTMLYSLGLLIFNDLFIRLYAGGTHDQVGKAWIMFFFLIAVALAIISMSVCAFMIVDKQKQGFRKTIFAHIGNLLIATSLMGGLYYYVISDI